MWKSWTYGAVVATGAVEAGVGAGGGTLAWGAYKENILSTMRKEL